MSSTASYASRGHERNVTNFPGTKLLVTQSASMRGLNFTDVRASSSLTSEEIQAVRAIQDLRSAPFSSSTPKANVHSYSLDRSFESSRSPMVYADLSQLMSPDSSRSAEIPQAKRRLLLHNAQQQVTLVQQPQALFPLHETRNGDFKTPQSKSERSRKKAQDSFSSLSSPSPRPKVNCLSPNTTSRYDSSLNVLAQRFIEYLNNSNDGIINLNEAAIFLDVPKRRIYDITNVLEGIDLVEKSGKNSCRWRIHPSLTASALSSTSTLASYSLNSSNAILQELEQKEQQLDLLISTLQDQISRTVGVDSKSYAYVTTEDLNSLSENVGKNLISIRASADSLIEVPDPADVDYHFYQMLIKTQKGELEVSVCPMRDPDPIPYTIIRNEPPLKRPNQLSNVKRETQPHSLPVVTISQSKSTKIANNNALAAKRTLVTPPLRKINQLKLPENNDVTIIERSPTLFEQAAHFAQLQKQRIQNQTPSSILNDPADQLMPFPHGDVIYDPNNNDVIAQSHFYDASKINASDSTPPAVAMKNRATSLEAPQPFFESLYPQTPTAQQQRPTGMKDEIDDVTPPLLFDDQYLFTLDDSEGMVDLFGEVFSDLINESMTSEYNNDATASSSFLSNAFL